MEPRSGSCRQCKEKHHTLIYVAKKPNNMLRTRKTEEEASTVPQTSCSAYYNDVTEQVMLSTAIVYLLDKTGKHECRTLLDQGSQVNVIKTRKSPPLPHLPCRTVILGVQIFGGRITTHRQFASNNVCNVVINELN